MSSEDEENVVCAVYAHSYTATPRGSLHPTGSPPSLAHITSAAGGSVSLFSFILFSLVMCCIHSRYLYQPADGIGLTSGVLYLLPAYKALFFIIRHSISAKMCS